MIDQDKAMKFRAPKTGEVFEDITDYIWRYTGCKNSCPEQCAIGRKAEAARMPCATYVRAHPAEVARLMGYEVVEDHVGNATEKVRPRICEVLGVEVGERFNIVGCSDFDSCDYDENQRFFIDSTGTLLEEMKLGCDSPASIADGRVVCLVWNHPDRILRQPRFTQEEAERAKAIKVLWPCAACLKKETGALMVYGSNGIEIAGLDDDTLPSLRPGQAVALKEVINATDR